MVVQQYVLLPSAPDSYLLVWFAFALLLDMSLCCIASAGGKYKVCCAIDTGKRRNDVGQEDERLHGMDEQQVPGKQPFFRLYLLSRDVAVVHVATETRTAKRTMVHWCSIMVFQQQCLIDHEFSRWHCLQVCLSAGGDGMKEVAKAVEALQAADNDDWTPEGGKSVWQ